MVVASSSTPGALTRVGAAAAGAALSVVVVLIVLPNVRRPGWLNGSLIFSGSAGPSPGHPRGALLVVCIEGRPRGESGGHRGHMERRRMGGRPELRLGLHGTGSYLAGRQSGALARHSPHRPARLCVWRARRPWVSKAPRLAVMVATAVPFTRSLAKRSCALVCPQAEGQPISPEHRGDDRNGEREPNGDDCQKRIGH